MSTFFTVQMDPTALSGAGAVSGATTIVLKSFTTIDGTPLTIADFGAKGYGTIDPGNGTLEEQISFTGITQNSNGTATLTGVSNVTMIAPYTETSGLSQTHAGSTPFVISNTSGFYSNFTAKANNEIVTGYWDVPDPVGMTNIANKEYVLSVVNGGSVSTNALIEVGIAGETLVAGNPVYFKVADGRWWKATGATAATVNNIQLGIAQGAGTAGNNISGGVLRRGIDSNQSGGSAGTIGYISDTSTISTSTGTTQRAVGQFTGVTTFDFDPDFYYIPTADQKSFLVGVTGMVIPYAGSAAPTGFLLCDGTAVSRTIYAALFTIIGTTYGVGDGSTTFNVPDGRGRSIIGAGTGTVVATFASRSSDTITVTGLSNAANNEFQTGQAVLYAAPSGAMTGLTTNTTYYVIRVTNTSFKLATSLANAQAGTAISLSSDGTGTQTFTLTLTTRTAGTHGGEENHAMSSTELLSHTHSVMSSGSGSASVKATLGSNNFINTPLTIGGTATGDFTGGNAAMNVMNPFFVTNWIIKT